MLYNIGYLKILLKEIFPQVTVALAVRWFNVIIITGTFVE
jgi:hypothetical protein